MSGIEYGIDRRDYAGAERHGGAFWHARESHPVGVPGLAVADVPGLRCAAPWAIESGPVGSGGLRPPLSAERATFDSERAAQASTEGATFDSPGCNPGFSCGAETVALKGRHSAGAPGDVKSIRDARADGHVRAYPCAGESHPVGVPGLAVADVPGLRYAAPWAIESGPIGAGGLHPPVSTEGATFDSERAAQASTEGATFDSPGCNPGFSCGAETAALKGRRSRGVPIGARSRGSRSSRATALEAAGRSFNLWGRGPL
jgi:hypothetical protein